MSASSSVRNGIGRYLRLLIEPLWVVAAFAICGVILAFGIDAFSIRDELLDSTIGQIFFGATLYILTVFVVVLPILSSRGKGYVAAVLGVLKRPGWKILWLPLLLWVLYMAATIVVSVFSSLLPFVDENQAQDVGFDGISQWYEYILAFIALVVLPPIAEELLFRGYLFGRIREKFGFWLTTIVVSIAFGFVHLQWNVGIDVAVLSIFLCYLREKTGSIWACMVLHAIKNGFAYTLLFIAPLWGINLLQ